MMHQRIAKDNAMKALRDNHEHFPAENVNSENNVNKNNGTMEHLQTLLKMLPQAEH